MELDTHFDSQVKLVHALIYGATKTKKTWWSGTAAEAGFDVTILFCDREGGLNILNNIPNEARKRIRVIDIQDRMDRPVSVHFISKLCKWRPFLWNQNDKSVVLNEDGVKPDCHHVVVRPMLLNQNDVLVLDSWTSHVESIFMQFDAENNIDPADAKKVDWDGFGWTRRAGTWHLNYLSHIPCNLIMIGHEQYYEKRKKVKEGNRDVEKVIWARTQPVSTSGPHSQIVSQRFDDIFHFFLEGGVVKINTRPGEFRDGGSSIVRPDIYQWDALTFKKIAEESGVVYNPELSESPRAFTFFKPGEEIDFEKYNLVSVKAAKFAQQVKASLPPKAPPLPGKGNSRPKAGTFAAAFAKSKEG